MIRSRALLFGTLLVGCTGAHETTSSDEQMVTAEAPNATAAKRLAQAWVDGAYASGIEVGLLHDGIVETYGVGRRDDVTAAAPDADTVFEIGSVSKVFTSLLLAHAVTRGEVTLDTPVQDLAPAPRGITLRHLSTHASGLPRMPALPPGTDFSNPYVDPWATYSVEQLFADLPNMRLATAPGTTYAYSNYAVGLLGQLLANKAGVEYKTLLASRVTTPLGLSRTGTDYPAGDPNIAQPHAEDGKPVPAEDLQAFAPAGRVRSTARDLLRFAEAVLEPDAAMALTRTVQADLAGQKMGLGWHFLGGNEGVSPNFIWHNGQVIGSHSFLGIDLARKQAVVVLANTGVGEIDSLASSLVQLLRGQTPAAPAIAPMVHVDAATLASYEGVYELSPTFAITITNEDGRTYARATNQPRFRIYPTSPTYFELHAVPAAIEFVHDAAGRVTSLVLHQNGEQTAVKVR